MTDTSAMPQSAREGEHPLLSGGKALQRRKAREWRMKAYGIAAIVLSLTMLAVMLFTIIRDGTSAFYQARLVFPVTIDAAVVDKAGNRNPEEMAKVTTVGYQRLLTKGFVDHLAATGIDVGDLTDKELDALISRDAAGRLRAQVMADPSLVGQVIEVDAYANGRIDGYLKGRVTRETAERDTLVTPAQLDVADRLVAAGILSLNFNMGFLTNPDASDVRPESSGLGVAIIGSIYMMVLVALMTVPVGVAASIYLEEFAPKNWLTDLIEVNINNLAAVPSIIFGLFGAAVFILYFKLPISSPLVGGLVLSLMTLPTVIIATRASLKAIPPSIREAALGIGASKLQAITDHVLPLALPGILTAMILGVAQALGETGPLLLIGMSAFVASVPGSMLDQSTALPVQIYLWEANELRNFFEGRGSAAIIVLLAIMLGLNAVAIWLRKRFETRW